MHSLTLQLLENRVRIESQDPGFLEGIRGCYAAPEDSPADATARLVVRLGRPLIKSFEVVFPAPDSLRAEDLELAQRVLQSPVDACSALNQWAVSATRRYHTFHAGAVTARGQALVMPGASRSGKTTLTVGLLQRGYGLLSDEVGAFDRASLDVVPFPRLPKIRDDVLDVLKINRPQRALADAEGHFADSSSLGWQRSGPATPGLILLPRYRRGEPTLLVRAKKSEATMRLVACSCSMPQHKTAGLDWIVALVERIPCYELTFSDLEDALDRIEHVFAEERPSAFGSAES